MVEHRLVTPAVAGSVPAVSAIFKERQASSWWPHFAKVLGVSDLCELDSRSLRHFEHRCPAETGGSAPDCKSGPTGLNIGGSNPSAPTNLRPFLSTLNDYITIVLELLI